MSTLIVQDQAELGLLWKSHLERMGDAVVHVRSEDEAVDALRDQDFGVIVLDLGLKAGDPLNVADYAGYRQPGSKVLFVTNTSFFSGGNLLSHYLNACGLVEQGTRPEDLAIMVEHYGRPLQDG